MSVVERAYDLEAPEELWVEGLLASAAPLLDAGHGLMGCVFDFTGPEGAPHARSAAAVAGPEEWTTGWRAGWWQHVVHGLPRQVWIDALSFGPVAYASHAAEGVAQRIATFEEMLTTLGSKGFAHLFGRTFTPAPESRYVSYPEALGVIASDPAGHSVGIFANRSANVVRPAGRVLRRTWSRVAAHVAAAHRLRRRLGTGSPLERADVVMAPGGRVVHAEGEAAQPERLEMLRHAAIAIDRARTTRVRATDEAFELWRALHDGRWSITDTFDHDGRRFLVARENEPASDPAPSLSRREQQVIDLLALGHSNKLIAYDLGISTSSVATHLRRAADKIGLSTTRDLVRWARGRRRPLER
ncbi:helix-turn-helix transcriptional regulator [Sandaracinus amylolyticus]|uniref:helix-turn-helix transcriptional regulator n=1 Tax=Sandaracinus amylolyticus TaxID=927083 RepID=UPI001F180700|nr:helix-turn-helix transcriptional regulator [Sandaracinus amylolyticus]